MGYTIIIGQANPEAEDYPVEITEDANAPIFIGDQATNNTNVRKPMYSEWEAFLQRVGLDDLFLNSETGLMRQHPGIEALTSEHVEAINAAYLLMTAFDEHDAISDLDFIRLRWLRFWTKWAITNCSRPVIYNA